MRVCAVLMQVAVPDLENVKNLFDQALRVPVGEARRAWIAARCGQDLEVLDEVTSLVAFHEQAERASLTGRTADVLVPQAEFGPYRAVEFLGRGGTSAVFRAERVDQKIHPPTALKVMAPFMSGPEFTRRFETEWRLLASLNHPHIAHLVEGGISSAGDPFLAIEYVEGERLDLYADRLHLSIADRLKLFLQICDAVDYAHRRMIVHRDLKPGNVLVTTDATVKLLDFGTATLLDADRDVTRTRSRMLTPRYASPERLRGEPASFGNDVYSLGVILYELLTGTWPFGDTSSPLSELERAVGDRAPSAPAVVVSADAAARRRLDRRGLERMLRGDLTTIVLKAIEQDPAERYPTVRDLSDDLARFLARRPVQARTPTLAYRSVKFLRRNWLPVSTAVLVAIGLGATTAIALREARQARLQETRTVAVNRFLTEILSTFSGGGLNGDTFTVVDMLAAAERHLDTGPKRDPVVEAVARRSLAESYLGLSRLADARRELDRALPMLAQLGDPVAMTSGLLTESRLDLAEGNYPAAEAHARQAVDLLAHSGDVVPADAFEVDLALAEALSPIALNGNVDEERRLLQAAIALADRDRSISRARVARALSVLGDLSIDEGRMKDAEALEWRALETGRTEDPGGLWETGPLYYLGAAKEREGDLAAARDFSAQELTLISSHAGDDRPVTAAARIRWARLAARTGQTGEAAAAVRRAMPIIEQSSGPASGDLWLTARDASVIMRLAGQPRDAERYARESLAAAEAQHLSDADPRLANSWDQLGQAQAASGKNADGIRSLARAVEVYRRAGPAWTSTADRDQKLIDGLEKTVK